MSISGTFRIGSLFSRLRHWTSLSEALLTSILDEAAFTAQVNVSILQYLFGLHSLINL